MDIDEISARFAISDVLFRLARGVDRNDLALVESAFHPGADLSLGYYVGDVEGYLGRFRQMSRAAEQPLTGVQHRIGNMLIEVHGDRARVESYYDVCWRRAVPDGGQVDELAAVRALDRMEQREGRWAILSRTLVWDWAVTLSAQPTPWAESDLHQAGRRDAQDPSVAFWDGPLG